MLELRNNHLENNRELEILYLIDVVQSAFGDCTKLDRNTLATLTIFFYRELLHMSPILKTAFFVGNIKIFGYFL